ncbi:APC family permease [Vibrio sp. FJH11]
MNNNQRTLDSEHINATEVNTTNKRDFKRVLGLKSLISVAVGLVVTQGVMVLMLQGVGISGLGFIIPLTIGYLLALTYIYSFSELSLMIPRAGSLSSYTEAAIGQFPAILSVFSGYVVVAMFALSAELLLVDLIFSEIFPGVFPDYFVGLFILGAFTWLNLMKIDIFSKIQTTLAFVMVLTLLLFGFSALTGGFTPHPTDVEFPTTFNPMGISVLGLVALAVWGFVGAEFVCPLVEETKNPEVNIPKSMILGATVIFFTIVIYCLGALFYIPTEQLSSSALPHLDYTLAVFGENGLILLAVVAVTATGSSVNTSLAAIPRMLYGMAENGQAFPQFKILTKDNTPWVAVIFVAIISGAPMVLLGNSGVDTIGLLLLAASVAWLVAYIITHVNVLVLRKRYPDANRPFKTPFYPLPQVLGIAGMVYAIIYVSPSDDLTQQIFTMAGAVLGITSVIGFLWVKFVMKQPLFKPKDITDILYKTK